jgi:DNA-binding transcriptional MerR regulator
MMERPEMDKAPDAFRTISEVADDLNLPQHVLRFWESRFAQIKPMKRGGGRRYYRPDDVDLLRGIRHLLYGEGYTIRGVQRILKDEGVKFVQAVWKSPTSRPEGMAEPPTGDDTEDDVEQVRGLLGLWPTLLGSSEHPDGDDAQLRAEQPTAEADDAEAALQTDSENDAESDAVPELEIDEDLEDSSTKPAVAVAPSGPELDRDAVLKLEATLFELSECRRLIDAALVSLDG